MKKGTFISSVSPYPEEEYFLGKSSWSTNTEDWGQRFEVGDVVADPSGSWEPGTAEEYIDQQIATEATTRLDQDVYTRSLIPLADEEDLTKNGSYLKFKDRTYNQVSPNGMGCIYLRKEDNFKTIIESVTQGNTIYVIRYNFTLTDNVTIPPNCVLEFDGGSIGGAYTLTGNNTEINAGLVKIFSTDINITGSWRVPISYPEWFGKDLNNAWLLAINKAIAIVSSGGTIELTAKEYYLGNKIGEGIADINNGGIRMKQDTRLYSGCYSRLYSDTSIHYYSIIWCAENTTIEGIFVDQSAETRIYSDFEPGTFVEYCITGAPNDVYILNCKFKHYSNAITFNAQVSRMLKVDSCEFEFFRIVNRYYDASSVYMRGGHNVFTNNKVMSAKDATLPAVGLLELHGHCAHCYENTFVKANIGIYICNDMFVDAPYYDDYHVNNSVLIHDNCFRDVNVLFDFVAIDHYRETDPYFQDIADVVIKDNHAFNVSNVTQFVNSAICGYRDIFILNNTFKSTLLDFSTSGTIPDLQFCTTKTAFICEAKRINNFIISGNVLEDFATLYKGGASIPVENQTIIFENNICKNILNYSFNRDSTNVQVYNLLSLIYIAGAINMKILNNIFSINEDNDNAPQIFNLASNTLAIIYKGNKIIGIDCKVTKDNSIIVKKAASSVNSFVFESDEEEIYPKLFTKEDNTFAVNDILMVPSNGTVTTSVCTVFGTKKVSSFTEGKLVRKNLGAYFEVDNYTQINSGDWLTFDITDIYRTTDYVAAKVGNKIWCGSGYNYNNTAGALGYIFGSIGDEKTINALDFKQPTLLEPTSE